MQGGAERGLSEIERRLAEVRVWWRRSRAGEAVAEAPEAVFLGRVMVGALDIAASAYFALERWQAGLDLIEEIEATKHSLGEGEHELARTRFNRNGPLLRLGRLSEAQRVLEDTLGIFRAVGDLANEAKALSALASLWNMRGDHSQAVALERQALAASNRFPDLEGRSISYGNLANYLEQVGTQEEPARYRLAAITYCILTQHHESLFVELNNFAIAVRSAATAGERYELPRLAALLERPDFAALRQALADRGVDIGELQATIDQFVEHVRQ